MNDVNEREETTDLRTYWRIFVRWWWLPVLGVVGGAVAGFLLSSAVTPNYQATTKVVVQGGATPGTPSLNDIEASQRLSRNYSDLIKTRPILDEVIRSLGLSYTSETLTDKIAVTSPRSLIEIMVTDPDPKLAADIANATAETFINDFRDKQFLQIAQFQASLAQYGILQDPGIIAAQASTMGALRVAEPAIPPAAPSSPRVLTNIVLAAGMGLLLATVVIFALEHLNDTVKSPDELKALIGVTTLGSVLRYPRQEGISPITLGEDHHLSAVYESYKFLRTNLQFAALGTRGFRTLLVTSASPEEGKTTTAANLAISVAREGKSVILVDSDLRKPAVHRVFDLKEQKGLTNLILGHAELDEVMASTAVDGLKVIPSGPVPPDATMVLGSPKMRELVEQLRAMADVVIFDSPPILAVTDPMILAPIVDCVLMVVDIERTSRDTLRRSADALRQANPAFVGAVMNKISTRGRRGGSYYYYYYYYYSGDSKNGRRRGSKRLGPLGKLLGRERRTSKV